MVYFCLLVDLSSCLFVLFLRREGRKQDTLAILKFGLIARPRGHKQKKGINVPFIFFCSCPLYLAIELSFNIAKGADTSRINS